MWSWDGRWWDDDGRWDNEMVEDGKLISSSTISSQTSLMSIKGYGSSSSLNMRWKVVRDRSWDNWDGRWIKITSSHHQPSHHLSPSTTSNLRSGVTISSKAPSTQYETSFLWTGNLVRLMMVMMMRWDDKSWDEMVGNILSTIIYHHLISQSTTINHHHLTSIVSHLQLLPLRYQKKEIGLNYTYFYEMMVDDEMVDHETDNWWEMVDHKRESKKNR